MSNLITNWLTSREKARTWIVTLAWIGAVMAACTDPPAPPGALPDLSARPPPDLATLPGIDEAASVLQHHKNPTRDGLYVDAALTRAACGACTGTPPLTGRCREMYTASRSI